MKSSVRDFEITNNDLKALTGLDKDDVLLGGTAFTVKDYFLNLVNGILSAKLEAPRKELTLLIVLWLFSVYIVGTLSVLIFERLIPSIPGWLSNIIIVLAAVITSLTARWYWLQKYVTPFVGSLVKQAENYNQVVGDMRAIDNREDENKQNLNLRDRQKIVEAMELARYDLVRAFTIERKFRKNKDYVDTEDELSISNVATLLQLRVSDPNSEYARLLNETLQVAVRTQEEMRKLSGLHDRHLIQP